MNVRCEETMLHLRRRSKIVTLQKRNKKIKRKSIILMVMMMISHIEPPYTSPTRGFYRSLHACTMHKPWAKTMGLCTRFYILVSYGILNMKRKYTKSKVRNSCFSCTTIVSYV